MADFYVKAFDFKIVRSNDGPLAYGHHLSDGTIDLAILRFKTDQLGNGPGLRRAAPFRHPRRGCRR